MEFLEYIQRKGLIWITRFALPREMRPIAPTPDDKLQIPSRDDNRTIPVHIYRSSATKPCPVLINFHGSGFVVALHGSDDEFAHCISQNTNYTVLDVAYRLAPEDPYPSAVNDVEDAVKWVLSRPEEFDRSKISVSGFSAGGNLALIAGSALFPQETFRHLIAFYPPTDLASDPSTKSAPDSSGKPIPNWMANIFNNSYLPPEVDRKSPMVSPSYTPAERFPDNVLIFTCARDSLCLEAEAVAHKIGELTSKCVILKRMDGCDHAWDKMYKANSVEEKAKDVAYELVIKSLRN